MISSTTEQEAQRREERKREKRLKKEEKEGKRREEDEDDWQEVNRGPPSQIIMVNRMVIFTGSFNIKCVISVCIITIPFVFFNYYL